MIAHQRSSLPLAVAASSVPLAAVAAVLVLASGCPQPVGGAAPGGGSGSGVGGGARVDLNLRAMPAGTGSPEPVAKIGPSVLTLGDLQSRLDKQSPFVRARYHSTEKKKEFLDNQVRFELLAQEALRRGLADDPDVQETIKKVMVQKLTRTDFEGKVKLSDVTEEEMKSYYDAHADEYNKPEMVRVSMIKVDFATDKDAARQKVTTAQKSAAAPDKLEDRAHFRRLVTEVSTDAESQKTGGDLRYLSEKELTDQFGKPAADAVWGLQGINDVTGVLEGEGAFYVFKKTGKRKPITRGYDQVKNQIRNLLYREKRTETFNAFVEQLKKDFNVEIFEAPLEKLEVKAGPEGGDGTLLPPEDMGMEGLGQEGLGEGHPH